jgi:cell division septation protein DedD
MAREWRRAVFAALAAAMLGGACMLGAQLGTRAYAANEEAEEDQEPNQDQSSDPSPAADAQRKGGKKRQDPAEAQRSVEAALKQVQAGRAEQAVQALTATLSAGNLPPALMAKALYVRGLAYRRQGRSAQAISDLNSALWLKGGLGGEDRVEATKERSAAYADAGLGGGREPEGPAPKTASGNWLSGLFGSPTPAAEAPARQPAPAPAPARAEAPPPAKARTAVSSGWSSTTEVQTDRSALAAAAPAQPRAAAPAPPPRKVAPPPVPAAAPPAARIGGRYLVQLAPVRTEAEARALAAKVKREPTLASRQAAIDHAVLGNMGAFYRVRFGPFASAQETQAVCAKLQASGFDCLPVGP